MFCVKGLFKWFKGLANLLDLFDKLNHLLALAEPRAKLGGRSQFGLDRQWTDQGVPITLDLRTVFVKHLALLNKHGPCRPMPVDLGQRLRLVRNPVSLAT